MKKIYKIRNQAIDTANKRGHLIPSKFERSYAKSSEGNVIQILKSACILCSAEIAVIDNPDDDCVAIGSALEKNCVYGSVKVKEIKPFAAFVDEEKSKKYKKILQDTINKHSL